MFFFEIKPSLVCVLPFFARFEIRTGRDPKKAEIRKRQNTQYSLMQFSILSRMVVILALKHHLMARKKYFQNKIVILFLSFHLSLKYLIKTPTPTRDVILLKKIENNFFLATRWRQRAKITTIRLRIENYIRLQ